MEENQINYYFTHLRRGFGAQENFEPGGPRPAFDIPLTIRASPDISAPQTGLQRVAIYGPGDVLGFEAERMVKRFQPVASDTDFTANNIPFIDFAEADFAWRYSSARGQGTDFWIPWLCLIVLKMDDGEEVGEYVRIEQIPEDRPPQIVVKRGTPMPDIDTSWRWAHVFCQDVAVAEGKEADILRPRILDKVIPAGCRLLAPRYLEPGVKYQAFVVPAYQLGVDTGIGQAPASGTDRTTLSWTLDERGRLPDDLQLPYYFQWEFRTSKQGDFEQLLRLLEPRPIEMLGGKLINFDNPGYGLQHRGEELRKVQIRGVLKVVGQEPSQAADFLSPRELQTLKDVLNRAETKDRNGNPILDTDGQPKLQVVPPIYGRWVDYPEYADVDLDLDQVETKWLEMLNLNLNYRFAAGLGVQYVKENQELLMEAAWQQLRKLEAAGRLFRQARFGRAISDCLHKRLRDAPTEAKLSVTGPVTPKVLDQDLAGNKTTVFEALRRSELANTTVNAKARKYGYYAQRRLKGSPSGRSRNATHISLFTRILDIYQPELPSALPEAPTPLKVTRQVRPSAGTPEAIGERLKERIDPNKTINNRYTRRLSSIRSWEERRRAAQGVPRTRSIETEDQLRQPMAYPVFQTPLYRFILEKSQDYFVPGIEHVPPNTVSGLSTNSAFIQGFMVGANHEFASELRWRGYPTDLRGTYFRKFWDTTIYSVDDQERELFWASEFGDQLLEDLGGTDRATVEEAYEDRGNADEVRIANAFETAVEKWLLTREEEQDIPPLHAWSANTPLGQQNDVQDAFVLLIRAELIRKYPNVFIYLVGKTADGRRPLLDGQQPPVYPSFEARLPTDITCLGFDIPAAAARSYFVVFEELGFEQRFGLDASIAEENGQALENLSWEHFEIAPGEYLNNTTPSNNAATEAWENAAQTAKAMTQRPVRSAIDLISLLPENS